MPAQPLHFLSSDSLVVWSRDAGNLQRRALAAGETLRGDSLTAPVLREKALRQRVNVWQRTTVATLGADGCVHQPEASEAERLIATREALREAATLFLLTRQGTYIDAVEQMLYNGIAAAAAPARPLSLEKRLAAQMLHTGIAMSYSATHDEGTVYVNLYQNSSAYLRLLAHVLTVDLVSDQPLGGKVRLRLGGVPHGGLPLTIALRIPRWAQGGGGALPTVFVNGRELLDYDFREGYLYIARRWNRGDEVAFTLPLVPSLRTCGNEQALFRGALLYPLDSALLPATASDLCESFDEHDPDLTLITGTASAAPGGERVPFTARPLLYAAP